MDGYVLDTYGNKALANDTFIQGSGAITLNEDGTLNIPADSDITIHGDSKVHSTTAVTVDKDGNVVIKTGETVTVENENGSETIITGPAIIDKDGDVTVSPGGSVGSLIVPNDDELKIPLNEIGDITTDTENGGVDMPKDTVVTIHETVITGKVQLNTDGSATINEPTTTVVVAGKITITGGPSKVAADGTVTVEADKDTTITLKNGVTIKGPATVDRDGASVEVGTGSSIKNGDTDVVVTNGKATVNADGSVVVPAGSVVTVNGVTITGEATISADGKIVSVETDGKIKIEDKEYTVETGKVDVKVEDSSMEIPAGSTVKIGDVTITGPASIDANGVVTVQTGGKIKVGEKEYEVILGTVTLEDEQLVIPENSKVRDEKGGVIAGPRTVNPSDTGNQEYSAGSSLQVGDKTVTVEDGSVTVGTDGTINVPEGTTVKVGDKTITGPASISPDGETTVTTGGSVTAGDTTVTVKDGEVTVEGDGSIKIPSGTTVEVKVTDEDGNVVSTTVTGPGSVSADGETVTVEPTGVIDGVGPDGATVQVTVPEGTEITVPVDQADQVTTNENDDIVVPVGAVITKGDVAVEVKNGEVTIDSENGNVTVADDAVVEINGVKITGPATVDKDGNVTVQADGKINDYVVPEGDITIPGGDMDEVSGSEEEVSLPAGSIVTGEVSVEVVTGSVTVDDEGNITVPDESVIKIGDTTITGPASVDKDGNVKVEEEGKINGVVVPNGTTIVVPADDLDDVTTTDDKITVPADSTVTTGDTKVEVESGEVTVGGDGSIAVPTGSTIKVGDTTITGPATVDKDGNVTVDAGGKIDNGDDSYTVPADTKVTVPADKLDDVIKDTEGNTVIPEGSTITTCGVDVEVEKGNVTVDDEGNITVPDDSTIKVGDTTITGPATVDKDGNVTVDAGGKIDNGNGDSYTVPDGTTITIPGGKLDEVTTDENGTTFPEGTKIDMGGDPKVVVTGPATIDKDGNVNVEQGGKITVGEGEKQKEYTVEEGTVTVTKDDEVKIDSGAKVEDEEGVVITGPADLNDNGKTAAKAAIDAAVNDAKAKIDSNTELSDEAKEILKDSIDEAVAEAEKAITNATTTEQVEKAKDDCIEAIEALGNASHSHMEGDDIFTLFSGELKGDVYLLRDEVLTDDVTISEDVCLCLSGKTFNLAGHTITVAAGATLTICDCQSTLTHGIVNDGLWSPHANGAVTLTGGVIFGGSMEVEGELAVTGGNLAGLRGGVKLSNGGKLTVSGGKLCHNVK